MDKQLQVWIDTLEHTKEHIMGTFNYNGLIIDVLENLIKDMKKRAKREAEQNGYFEVTSIHRNDLQDYFTSEEIAKLTDEDMKDIASNMADAYCEGGQFWSDIQYLTREILDEKE